jgi:C4-type Zn-finger protein
VWISIFLRRKIMKKYECPKCHTTYDEDVFLKRIRKVPWGRRVRDEIVCIKCKYRAFIEFWKLKEEYEKP